MAPNEFVCCVAKLSGVVPADPDFVNIADPFPQSFELIKSIAYCKVLT
jgi:hypothetical protein